MITKKYIFPQDRHRSTNNGQLFSMKITRFLPLLVLFTLLAFTQKSDKLILREYPQDYFISPVKHTIRLAGTFGELRPNHFHAGIDIKSSAGKVGDPLYAPAEGHISRIKIQSGAYGNAMYIEHPNGYTTVYAHLLRYMPEVDKWIKEQQYDREKFEVDLYPAPGQFPLKQGDLIGKMGTSGRSYGPHLHFEVRDTRTQKAINPMLFGFKMKDTRAPKMHQIKVYSLNDKHETMKMKVLNVVGRGANKYGVSGDTITIGAWRTGLALKVYDHHDNVSNWNGVYSVEMLVDDVPTYAYKMETFAFKEMRFLNAHIDYGDQVEKKAYFNRMYRLPGNEVQIYEQTDTDGVIELSKNRAKKITMIANDIHGNETRLEFWVKRGEVKDEMSKTFNYFLPWNEENKVVSGGMEFYFPNGTLYENLYLNYNAANDKSNEFYSNVHQIQDYKTPVHKYFDLSIAPNKSIPEGMTSKAFVAYCYKDKIISFGGEWENGMLKTKVRDLGDFAIMLDTKPPVIQAIRYKSDMRGFAYMSFKATDNFTTDRITKGMRFRAEIDGEWALLTYDAKNDLIRHDFRDDLPKGEHHLRLVVTDDRGNSTVFERDFVR